MTNNIAPSVHNNVELANNSIPTLEEVYAIDYVRESIRSVIEQTVRQYPILESYKDDLQQEILIHLYNELPKYNQQASINVFCRICINSGLKMAKRKYLRKSRMFIHYAVPVHELECDIDHDTPRSNDIKAYENYAKNNIEDDLLEKDILSILETCSHETKQICLLLLEGYSTRKIATTLKISRSIIRYKHLAELKNCFSKEFFDFFKKVSPFVM